MKFMIKMMGTYRYLSLFTLILVFGCETDLEFFTIHFTSFTTEIVEEDSSLLYENLEIIKDNSDINVELAGHTNSIGPDSENLILSLARADTVRLWLIRNSIDSVRLTTIGFGETEPVADNRTAEGRVQNDRVEFIKK